jgi:hypothetical protein
MEKGPARAPSPFRDCCCPPVRTPRSWATNGCPVLHACRETASNKWGSGEGQRGSGTGCRELSPAELTHVMRPELLAESQFESSPTLPWKPSIEAGDAGSARSETPRTPGSPTSLRTGSPSTRRGSPWCAFAGELLAWTKCLCLEGDLACAEPERLLYTLVHTGGIGRTLGPAENPATRRGMAMGGPARRHPRATSSWQLVT